LPTSGNKDNIAVQKINTLAFLLIATTFEVSGDAIVRVAIYNHVGPTRIGLMLVGAALLFGYGSTINLAPVQFGQVVGLYIATLFVVWQILNYIVFRAFPNLPIVVGGVLIIAGGMIVTFWSPRFSK
jgi:small multidrug resistance family-3 protein